MLINKNYFRNTFIEPDLTTVEPDADAVYLTFPLELRDMVLKAGFKLEKFKLTKTFIIARK